MKAASRARAAPRAILCVTIDCERDKGPGWRVRRPASFRGVHEGIAGRLHPLFLRLGVKPTYLLSPEVMRDGAAAERVARLAGSLELGAHLHGEYVGPDLDDQAESVMFQAALPPAVERAKLAALTALYARTFGRQPRSFRAGRFGIGPASLPALGDLGYAVDSSVTPFIDWTGMGTGAPCFDDAPVTPYRPDPASPARPGPGALWEVPLTIRPCRPRALTRLPLFGRLSPPRWLRPTWGSAGALVRLARRVMDEPSPAGAPPPVLNIMFHNVEVVAGASPYAGSDGEALAILGRLAALLAFARDAGAVSVGLADVPELLA